MPIVLTAATASITLPGPTGSPAARKVRAKCIRLASSNPRSGIGPLGPLAGGEGGGGGEGSGGGGGAAVAATAPVPHLPPPLPPPGGGEGAIGLVGHDF